MNTVMNIFGKRSPTKTTTSESENPPLTGSISLDLPDLDQWNISYGLGMNKVYEQFTGEHTGEYEQDDRLEITVHDALISGLYSEDWEKHLGLNHEDNEHETSLLWIGEPAKIAISGALTPDDFRRRKTSGSIGEGWRYSDSKHLVKLYLTRS